MSNTQDTVTQVTTAVSGALTALSPLMGPAAPVVAAIAPSLPAIVAFVERSIEQGLDPNAALVEALDARLAAKFAAASDALKAKHEHDAVTQRSDEPTVELPVHGGKT